MRHRITVVGSLASGAIIALSLLVPAPAFAATGHSLRVGHSIGIGEKVVSKNGLHALVLRRNGSLERVDLHHVTWSTKTQVSHARAAGTRLRLTASGRLLLLRHSGHIAWRSSRVEHAKRLTISDSGQVQLQTGAGTTVPVPAFVAPVTPTPVASTVPAVDSSTPSAATPSVTDGAGSPVSTPAVTTSAPVVTTPVPASVAAPAVATPSDRLGPDQRLQAGQSIRSGDGRFTLVMQTDGNLVLYGPSGALWATNRQVGNGAFAVMQTDGNFVVYKPGGGAAWASSTGTSGSSVVLQSDGNLVVYAPGGKAVWASNTVQGSAAAPATSNPVTTWAAAQVGQKQASAADAALFGATDWAGTTNAPYGEWSGDCAKFAIAAWRHAGRQIETGDAVTIYNKYKAQGRVQGGTAPAGALVFYPTQSKWGHIAISDGAGGVYTTQGLDTDWKPIAHLPSSAFGASAGWTMPYSL